MALTALDIIFNIVSFIGFVLVAAGFGTRIWFFSETDRWQFKCDLRTCCVRDIDPTPKLWTCWPIKDPPTVFRWGEVLASCGLGLWLPIAVCLLAARAKRCARQAGCLALCFLMVAGGLGVTGCRMMFNTAEESFIIAEVPGVSGYMVLWGFSLTLTGSTLASRWMIIKAVDRTLNILGKLLGFTAALLFLLLRAFLYRPLLANSHKCSPICMRLKPLREKIFSMCIRFVSLSQLSYYIISVRLKSGFIFAKRTLLPYASTVIHLLRRRFFPIFAFAVFALTAVLTFFKSKMAALCTFTVTRLVAVLIVCSPRLYAIVESLRPVLCDRTKLVKVTYQFVLRLRDTIVSYLVGLVKPSFDLTLKYFKMKTPKSRRMNITKSVTLNGVTVH
ncbi:hypothetical protein EGW08_019996 [Elysia chlorotica]|uniref:Uncharacterized protein n=1 Tax=Elysia chlorotica TaxID=188477 RepID=A0A3S1AU86_ELYCH|nr:hypothetical protein EGW08_019996 [Elysia chlorotica]